jgi:transcriptional regulator with XRE-family HTH domain
VYGLRARQANKQKEMGMSRAPIRRLAPSGTRTGIERLEMQDFARRLHELRTAKGWNQSDLARAVWGEQTDAKGKTTAKGRDRISEYERGLSSPEPENLQALADALGVGIEDLAPKVTAATVDREDPALQFTMIAGHPDKVHLVINQLLPLEVAAKIVALISAATATAANASSLPLSVF